MTAGFAARRESVRSAPFSMTPLASDSAPAPSRTISTTASNSAVVLPGISAVPIDASAPNAPPPAAPASYEHGSYEFTPKELAAVKKRVEEEFLLKSVTTARPLAQQIRPEGKVPFEYADPSRSEVLHPSGFVVPSPTSASAHAARDSSQLISEIRPRTTDSGAGIRESVRTFDGLRALETVGTTTRRGKVPQEVLLADGSAVHGSGFVPPTPQSDNMAGVKEMFKPAVRAH